MSQSQPLRIEDPERGSFVTSRTINSRLWYVNNAELEERLLGWLARYREKYEVKLYAFVRQGNHDHSAAVYPKCNRAGFQRDLKARTAEAVRYLVPNFPGGPLFERRYSEQALPGAEELEEQFFYCALQPVKAGLVQKSSEYPGYNSFNDAISGRIREIRFLEVGAYHEAKKKDPRTPIKDYYRYYTLKYERLPGYEHLSQKEYRKLMLEKYEKRRVAIVEEYMRKGHKFLTREELLSVEPGALPRTTKKSKRYDKRPLVLTKSVERKKQYLAWYFSIYEEYKRCAKAYLGGDIYAVFPARTYRPPGLLCAGAG